MELCYCSSQGEVFIHLEMHLQKHLENGARNDPVFDLVLNIQPCNE
jgi:hypothetical protein